MEVTNLPSTRPFSLYELDSLQAIVNVFEDFKNNTGLKVNKLILYRIGAVKDSQAKLKVSKNFKWSNDQITSLGITIAEKDLLEINYEPIMDQVENILKLWRMRDLSLLGKINVINTLVGALFIFKLQVLPSLNDQFIKMFDSKLMNLIWNGCRPKVKQSVTER